MRGDSTLIDEAGLYSLVMKSKLPAAEDFQEWVTSDVLPSIRKTGEYKINQELIELRHENQQLTQTNICL